MDHVEFQGQTEIKKWRPLLKLGLVPITPISPFETCGASTFHLRVSKAAISLMISLTVLLSSVSFSSLRIRMKHLSRSCIVSSIGGHRFIAFILAAYLEPMQVLRVVGVPEDELAHGGVDAAARLLGTQI